MIVGRAIIIQRAIEKRNYESMYKTDTKIRATTFAIANLKDNNYMGSNREKSSNRGKINNLIAH